MSKLVKEFQASPSNSQVLGEELDSRINEIKRMRDGAEMDLDLDITQRMLENDQKEVSNMDEVVTAVGNACAMLENENGVLDAELE